MPYFQGIYEALKTDIQTSRLPAHTLLPPQRKLAAHFVINLDIVMGAFRLCEERGLIYAVNGKEIFVAPQKYFGAFRRKGDKSSH